MLAIVGVLLAVLGAWMSSAVEHGDTVGHAIALGFMWIGLTLVAVGMSWWRR